MFAVRHAPAPRSPPRRHARLRPTADDLRQPFKVSPPARMTKRHRQLERSDPSSRFGDLAYRHEDLRLHSDSVTVTAEWERVRGSLRSLEPFEPMATSHVERLNASPTTNPPFSGGSQPEHASKWGQVGVTGVKTVSRSDLNPPELRGHMVELRRFELLTPSMRRVIWRHYLSSRPRSCWPVSLTQPSFSRSVLRSVISCPPGSKGPFGVK
jgi:hypothetical protein